MAIEFARAGFKCVGLDVDRSRVEAVNLGRSPVSNVEDAEVAELRNDGRLDASTDARILDAADVAVICVPTPLTSDGGPDLHFVENAGATIAEHLRAGMLVVLQSTCGPGTTTRSLVPLLELVSNLRDGEDFFVAFAPERIDPGNLRFNVKNTPKLVGGTTPEATRAGCELYRACIDEVVPVSSPEVAELAKLVENTFRFINISFINEMALLCDRLGVNVWEVIEAARTKPFAFMPHYPSPGVGGHCIPVVPQYLQAAAHEHGLIGELIPAANRINETMPKLIVNKLERALQQRLRKPLVNARVLLVGITYKPDIADVRESAALRVFETAFARGARVTYHDPFMPSVRVNNGDVVASVDLDQEALSSVDAVVLLTPHTGIDYDRIIASARLVLDTHSGLQPREAPNVVNVWVPERLESRVLA
ncbi:MAG: nucleotide sugar dehydrogenase [Chloroflexi bacterium]|nr:nucleotide sugar dehydrogenase [Chloroflexota bacterium]MBV9602402.1 nucleotide sugar dehydrogenase [Chloroflexota bacterium]